MHYIEDNMSTIIDYKTLYESEKFKNDQLLKEKNELTETLERYKMHFMKHSSYEQDIQFIMEDVQKAKKYKRRTS
jgi:hypothetical protein